MSLLADKRHENDINMQPVDETYVESAAYHEAAHIVVAVAQKIPLRSGGVHIDFQTELGTHWRAMLFRSAIHSVGRYEVGPDCNRPDCDDVPL
jgi:hypothetical protein